MQGGNAQWQQAEELRQRMFPNNPNLSQMVTNVTPQDEREQHYLPLDTKEARQAIFRIANENNRQVIIINSTYDNTLENEDPLNHLFMTLNADGDIVPYEDFEVALQNTGNNPIILLYTPGHWQAVLQETK